MQNHTDPDAVGPADAPEPAPTSGDDTTEPDTTEPGTTEPDTTEPPATAEPAAPAGADAPPPDPAASSTASTPGTPPAPTSGGPTAGNPPPPASTGDGFFGAMRRMGVVRTDDRWVGGVCSGLARRFDLDPLLVRGIFAVTVLVAGFGLVLYGLAWAVLPEARDGRIHLQETLAGRFDSAMLGALGMVLLGLIRGDGWLWWGRVPEVVQGLAWMAFLGVVITVVVVSITGRGRKSPAPYPPGPPAGPAPVPPRPAYPTASYPAASYSMPEHPTTYQAATPPLGSAPTTYAPPAPPMPVVTQRRPGPGSTVVGLVVAMTLIAAAWLLLVDRSGHLDAPVGLVAAGVCVVLAGIGIVVSGLRGRRSGVLGFLAIVTLLFAGPWAVYEAGSWPHQRGDGVVTLSDVDSAQAGVDQGIGDVVVDLRHIPLAGDTAAAEPAEPDQTAPEAADPPDPSAAPEVPEAPVVTDTSQTIRVPVQVGVGDVKILLPDGVDIRVEAEVGAGQIEWQIDGRQTANGFALNRTFRTGRDADGPELVVDVSIGVGNLTISH